MDLVIGTYTPFSFSAQCVQKVLFPNLFTTSHVLRELCIYVAGNNLRNARMPVWMSGLHLVFSNPNKSLHIHNMCDASEYVIHAS